MNGKVAKKIRKLVYQGEKEEPVQDRGYIEQFGGIFVCTGKRREYQAAKKDYKHFKNLGQVTFKGREDEKT